jgi:hypothetical protein
MLPANAAKVRGLLMDYRDRWVLFHTTAMTNNTADQCHGAQLATELWSAALKDNSARPSAKSSRI